MKQITVNDKGVYVQETYKLTAYGIEQSRRRLQGQILGKRRKIQDAKLKIHDYEKEIINLEEQMKTLNSPLVDAYLEHERLEKEEILKRSQEILKEMIGDTLYQELQLKKKIVFEAKDKMTYKIEANGKIYRRVNTEWSQLCIIRPNELPLPDFLLALFISIRESPHNYHLRRWR